MKNHAAIILHDQNKILFIKRSATKKSLPNMWAFPSGTMEIGESAETTVIREAKEELGIYVEIEKLLAKVELLELKARLYFLICTNKSDKPIVFDPEEIQRIKWMTFADFLTSIVMIKLVMV